MPKYKVYMEKTIKDSVEVEAEDEVEAIHKAHNKTEDGWIVSGRLGFANVEEIEDAKD